MKKISIVMTVNALCVAFLFAQEAMDLSQSVQPAAPVAADSATPNLVEAAEVSAVIDGAPAVADQTSAVETAAVVTEIPAAVEEVAAEDAVEVDEVGIVDDLTAGAAISGGLISISLKDVELQDVVRLFGRLSNANIIVPDMVDKDNPKRIDVNLDNVEWKPALQAILDTHGLELVEKIPGSDVYSIRERPADAPEPVAIRVFKLDYATVDEVVKMVDVLVKKEGGQISTYPARNSIVAQGTAKMINDLEQIVTAVDLPREQVFIEAKFLELTDSASRKLGIDWSVLGGYRVGLENIYGSYDRIEGSTDDGDAAGWVTPLGVNVPVLDDEALTKTLGATLTADDFSLVLSALRDLNGVSIVSNPKIIVANEQTATIQIGQKKPNIKGTIQTAGDSQVNRVYELDDLEPYFQDGVIVEVTPTINTEDNITVRIEPTLDRLDPEPTIAPDGTEFYGKQTKTINTVFSLEDGQTAAIGGLTQIDDRDIDRKVPLLGDLPLLGRLFSYKSKNNQQVETIIFVTVGMANPKSVHFETGLPEDSRLAMRYHTKSETDRKVNDAELDIQRTMEAERLQERLDSLRSAEEKRLNKSGMPEQNQVDADSDATLEQLEIEREAAQMPLEEEASQPAE